MPPDCKYRAEEALLLALMPASDLLGAFALNQRDIGEVRLGLLSPLLEVVVCLVRNQPRLSTQFSHVEVARTLDSN